MQKLFFMLPRVCSSDTFQARVKDSRFFFLFLDRLFFVVPCGCEECPVVCLSVPAGARDTTRRSIQLRSKGPVIPDEFKLISLFVFVYVRAFLCAF